MGKKIVEKLDKIVTSMRGELEKHDGSTIQTIYSNAKEGFASIRRSLSRSEKASKLADDIKKLGEDFVGAIKAGDRKLSGKLLSLLEKKTKEYKKEKNEADKAKAAPAPKADAKPRAAAKARAAKPAAKAAPKAKPAAKPAAKAAPKASGKSAE